ncbi:hypothetical protein BROUX41_002774 [Berkeleyomyces rouxiae]|uniref:uncharacterized protein n=1 Tax=Berkeleyomyces rouxiae TaxID=2035830 RepID=UPI003B79602F
MLSRSKSRSLWAADRQPQNPQRPQTLDQNLAVSANVAAVNAFSNHQQNAAATSLSLSAAAATAALRANPTPKTNVGQVQTKRNLRRRSSSLSSSSSTKRAFGRLSPSSIATSQNLPASMRRSPSVSSMSERTFRAQSPAMSLRGNTTEMSTVPVPGLPRNNHHPLSASTSRGHQRSSSASEPNIGSHKRSLSEQAPGGFVASTLSTMDNRLAAAVKTNQPVRPRAQSFNARPTSPSLSINFSYPRPNKGAGSSTIIEEPEETMVYDANSRRLVPKSQLDALNRDLQMAEAQPSGQVAKSTKHQFSANFVTTSLNQSAKHVNNATPGDKGGNNTRARPKSSSSLPYTPGVLPMAPPDRTSSARHAAATTTQRQSLLHKPPAKTDALHPTQPNTLHDPSRQNAAPPVPHQQLHGSAQQESDSASYASQSQGPSNTRKSSAARPASTGSAVIPSSGWASQWSKSSTALSAPEKESTVIDDPHASSTSLAHTASSQTTPLPSRPGSSHYPAVSHSLRTKPSDKLPFPSFSSSETHTPDMSGRHLPPPRSLSPRKSALKNSRGPSHSSIHDVHNKPRSMSQDGNIEAAVKKVSFDQATVMHPDDFFYASDGGGAPQKKKLRWLTSLGRSRRKTKASNSDSDLELESDKKSSTPDTATIDPSAILEDLAVEDPHDFTRMGPLPMLPSFKSIREKQSSPSPEGTVRGSDPEPTMPCEVPTAYEPRQLPTIRSGTELNTDYMEADAHYSLDHIVFSDENTHSIKDHQNNASRFCEPLPPIVTSVNGTGYGDTPSPLSDDSEEDASGSGSGLGSIEDYRQSISPTDGEVPPVVPDPPGFSIMSSSHDEAHGLQEGFPRIMGAIDYEDDGNASPSDDDTSDSAASPNRSVRFANDLPKRPVGEESTSDSESDGSSVYTDAYEDFDGDGFQSLNAVVMASPIAEFSTTDSVTTPTMSASKLSAVSETPLEDLDIGSETDQATPTLSSVTSPQSLNSSDDTQSQSPIAKGTAAQSSFFFNTALPQTIVPAENSELDWERAKAYWKSLSPEKRRQLELEAQDYHPATLQQGATPSPMSPRPAASLAPMSPQSLFSFQGSTTDELGQVYEANAQAQMISTISAQAHIVSTFVTQTPKGIQPMPTGNILGSKTNEPLVLPSNQDQDLNKKDRKMAKAPRARDNASDDDSVVTSVKRSALQKKKLRPFSYTATFTQPVAVPSSDYQRHASLDIPSSTGKDTRIHRHSLQRQDSESSFRRSRGKSDSVSNSFRYSTMRDSPMASTERIEPLKHGKFNLRSFSPSGFRRGSSPALVPAPSASESALRKSMREPASSGKKGFFSKASRTSRPKGSVKPNTSRFDNSSDEEAGNETPAFQSRYADSSDDEGPSRSVTSNKTYSRSEAAPEIDQSLLELARKSLAASNQIQPSNLSHSITINNEESVAKTEESGDHSISKSVAPKASTLSDAKLKKSRDSKGLMSALRRRKDPSKKIQRAPPTESAARRDTPLERSSAAISALRTDRTAPKGSLSMEALPHSIFEESKPTASSLALDSSTSPPVADIAAQWPLGQDAKELHELERVSSLHSASRAALGTSSVNRACASDAGGYKGLGISTLATKSTSNTALPSFTPASIMGPRESEVVNTPTRESHDADEAFSVAGPSSKKKFGKLRKMLRITD